MNVTLKDLDRLYAELLREERIMKSRLSVESLQSLIQKNLCVTLCDKKGVYGFAALWPTARENFFELGTCWIQKERRGKGFFSPLFDNVVSRAKSGSVVFLITKSAKVAHEAKKRKWEEGVDWQHSAKWQKACHPICGSNEEAKRSFSADCRLFYTILV